MHNPSTEGAAPHADARHAVPAMRRGRLRFVVLSLIFVITVLNYADRATLSIAGPSVARDLGLSPSELGIVFSAFAWAYVIGQFPGGWLLDRYGARRVYGGSLLLWSLFTLSQGSVHYLGSAASAAMALFGMRFLLGLVEAPAFPANARVVATWFPAGERGIASALFNSAQYLAVVLFTPLMAWLTHTLGWPHVFLVMGVLGVPLALVWFAFMDEPTRHRRLSAAELDYMREGGALVTLDSAPATREAKPRFTWAQVRQLLTHRMMWGLYIGQYCITALSYFFITWFPIYLMKGRGMSIMTVGMVAALPAICGFSGGMLGGALSDFLIRRGVALSTARKIPFMLGMALATSVVAANFVSSNTAVIVVMSLAFFGKGLSAIGWAVVSDTAPREMTGLCGGIFNGLGNIAGIVTPIVIGYVVAVTGSFDKALWFVAAHGLLGVIAYGVIAGPFRRLVIK